MNYMIKLNLEILKLKIYENPVQSNCMTQEGGDNGAQIWPRNVS